MSTDDSALLGVNKLLDNFVTSGVDSEKLRKADGHDFTLALVTVFLVDDWQLVGVTLVISMMGVAAKGASLEGAPEGG